MATEDNDKFVTDNQGRKVYISDKPASPSTSGVAALRYSPSLNALKASAAARDADGERSCR